MEALGTKQNTRRSRYFNLDKHGGINRKRVGCAKNERPTEHPRKSLRLQENPNRLRRNANGKFQPQPTHKSSRLQETRDLNQPRVEQEGQWTESLPRTTRTHRFVGQKRPQAERKILKDPLKCQNISALTTGAPVDRSRDSIRKRRRGEDDIVETQPKRQKPPGNQAQPSRAFTVGVSALTSQNLKRLSHQVHSQHFPSAEEIALGQPGFVNMPKSQRTETKSRQTEETSSSTKTVSSSDSRFQKIAAKNGVLVPMDSTEPSNLDDIYNYLNRPRESVSPDFEEFKSYRWKAVTADNEDTVKLALIRHLKEYDDGKYRSAYNQQFTEYPANVGFNDGLSPAKPDLVQGINLQNFEPYPVVQELGGAAVPTPSRYPIALAHMAGEFKRPGGNLIEAQSQAAYDAASLVYGRNVARESMNRADPPSAAHVGSFISDGTHITTFTHYATKDASGKIVYHQWPVTDTNIQLGYQSFKTGRRQVRNLQDWTRENSYLLKKELLDHYKLSQTRNNESIPEGVVCREYRNSCSSTGSSVALGSEPYVVVDGPTQLKSLPTFEAEDLYVTPHSSDPARSRRHERLTSPVDMETRVPKQRNKRSSARLLERRHRQNRD